ncbi:hypothetical protein G6F70_005771 [Rhizopus microsporus]|uniref:Zinc/iron permease n=2 Tax=Rhizopus TaxID=4842 RepID=A0A367JZS8_RHIAZ|nr:hypothetical protein G6F71_005594 [Rhizopus microsporus]RCH95428.1 hypothetical protein CU097_002871 [Rhizopus azygosporus]KAG1198471.1 hypothetical protein G6F70_005771 [Rhizopus microsporus]KAG1210204.1 hypothetical protein G6F69_005690 [Rhizopus microsporus]KAG1231949.1 hypothetical protein G6F67_005378 [Rhizopus microsporus]
MEPLSWLIILSVAMFIGSYIAGSLPLAVQLSQKKVHLLSSFGGGMLIGTCLVVVIPEGTEAIYKSTLQVNNTGQQHLQKRDPNVGSDGHAAMGIALIVGFALMFIIDQLSSQVIKPSMNGQEYSELEVISGERVRERDSEQHRHDTSTASVTGLLIHAAADGIALGASVTRPELSVIVFLAIILHKAPAAFGLTSLLLNSGLTKTSIQKYLILFALAAPTGSILTYLILGLFSSNVTSTEIEYFSGLLLVFSGGTFLFVAMHALQETSHSKSSEVHRPSQLLITLAGMLIPTTLNIMHNH